MVGRAADAQRSVGVRSGTHAHPGGQCPYLLVLPLHLLKLAFHLGLLLLHLQQFFVFGLELFLLAGNLQERLHL